MTIGVLVLIVFAALALGAIWYFEKGWRTIIANAVLSLPLLWDALVNVGGMFLPLADQYGIASYIPEQYKAFYAIFIVGLNIVLRFRTTTPVGQK
jgi:hypothetical protein